MNRVIVVVFFPDFCPFQKIYHYTVQSGMLYINIWIATCHALGFVRCGFQVFNFMAYPPKGVLPLHCPTRPSQASAKLSAQSSRVSES